MSQQVTFMISCLVALLVIPPHVCARDVGETKASEKKPSSIMDAQDTWKSSKVEAALILDERISGYDFDVDVHKAHATLHGQVKTRQERNAAKRVALSVQGIDSVSNQLSLQTESQSDSTSVEDSMISAQINTRLMLGDSLSAADVDVHTREGIVTLSGVVDSKAEKGRAEAIAREIDHVQSVNNQLEIDER